MVLLHFANLFGLPLRLESLVGGHDHRVVGTFEHLAGIASKIAIDGVLFVAAPRENPRGSLTLIASFVADIILSLAYELLPFALVGLSQLDLLYIALILLHALGLALFDLPDAGVSDHLPPHVLLLSLGTCIFNSKVFALFGLLLSLGIL